MAFLKKKTSVCPYCKEKIKTDAIKCKHCGEWLKNDILKQNKTITNEIDSNTSGYSFQSDKISNMTNDIKLEKNISDKPEIKNVITENNIKSEIPSSKLKGVTENCLFCGNEIEINNIEINRKYFICPSCKKQNKLIEDENIRLKKNIPIGFGWYISSGIYYYWMMSTFKNTLTPIMTVIITVSAILLILIYFFIRKKILIRKYKKNKSFGKIYPASIASHFISLTLIAIIFTPIITIFNKKSDEGIQNKIMCIVEEQKLFADSINKLQNSLESKFEKVETVPQQTKIIDELINLNELHIVKTENLKEKFYKLIKNNQKDNISKKYYDSFDKFKNCLNLRIKYYKSLKQYYSTNDESFYNDAEIFYNQGLECIKNYQEYLK